jgi:ABC-type branched-subunit amino acid transport system permease subunit
MLGGMNTGLGIVIGAAILVAAALFLFRWDIHSGPQFTQNRPAIVLLDRWTGNTSLCQIKWGDVTLFTVGAPVKLDCVPHEKKP